MTDLLQQWSDDAFRIIIEVPTSQLTDEELADLFLQLSEAVEAWFTSIPPQNWDPVLYGMGPAHRKEV
jgi:hypothetical protein